MWTQLEFESAWISDRERVEAEQALRRFVAWHQGRPDRTLVGTEVDFDVLLPDEEHPAVRVYQTFVSAIERGEAYPTPDQRKRLAMVLG